MNDKYAKSLCEIKKQYKASGVRQNTTPNIVRCSRVNAELTGNKETTNRINGNCYLQRSRPPVATGCWSTVRDVEGRGMWSRYNEPSDPRGERPKCGIFGVGWIELGKSCLWCCVFECTNMIKQSGILPWQKVLLVCRPKVCNK